MAKEFNLSSVAKSAELTLGDIHASGKSAGQQATQAMSNIQNLSTTTLGSLAGTVEDLTYGISPSIAQTISDYGLMPTGGDLGAGIGRQSLSMINPALGGVGAGIGGKAGGESWGDAALRAIATTGGTLAFGPAGGTAANFLAGKFIGSGESSPSGQTPSEKQQVGIDKAAKAELAYAPEFDWGFGGKGDPGFGGGDTTAPAAPMDFSGIPSDFGQDDPAEPVGDPGYDFGFDEPADSSMGGGGTEETSWT